MPVNPKQVSARLSKQLANFKLSDAVINQLAQRVLVEGLSIGRLDPCIYGICVDYWSDKMPQLQGLSPKQGISRWEVFPYGIIDWDRFRVRIAFDVDELAGRGLVGDLVR